MIFLDEIDSIKNDQISINSLNESFKKLIENDKENYGRELGYIGIWECKWFNNNNISGYNKGDAVWINTQQIEQFIQSNKDIIEDYILNSDYYYEYAMVSSDVNRTSELFKNVCQGTNGYQRLFYLGDILSCAQIKVSLVDNNKELPDNSNYWADSFRLSSEETYKERIENNLSSYLSSLLSVHNLKYHETTLTPRILSTDFMQLDFSNNTKLQQYKNKYLDVQQQTIDGLEYIISEKYSSNAEGTKWYRLWRSGFLEHGGIKYINDITDNNIDIYLSGDNYPIYNYSSNTPSYLMYNILVQPFFSNMVYEIDVNDQWTHSINQQNPDPQKYDGVYTINTYFQEDTNLGTEWSKMQINFSGFQTFKIYIRSHQVNVNSYIMALSIDTDIETYLDEYDNEAAPTPNIDKNLKCVLTSTYDNSKSGEYIGDYTPVEYTNIDGGEHFIQIIYRKDINVDIGNDRGYVLIEKMSSPITIIFDIGNGMLIGNETNIKSGYQGRPIGNIYPNFGPPNGMYFIEWNTMPDGSGETYTNMSILPFKESFTLYAIYRKNYYEIILDGEYDEITNDDETSDEDSSDETSPEDSSGETSDEDSSDETSPEDSSGETSDEVVYQWRMSETEMNPDPSIYNGVYESFLNYDADDKYAVMCIKIENLSEFSICIKNESYVSSDVIIALQADTTINDLISSYYDDIDDLSSIPNNVLINSEKIQSYETGKSNNEYTEVKYSFNDDTDKTEHFINIIYKNGKKPAYGEDSNEITIINGKRRGYLLIERIFPKMNGYGEMDMVNVVGLSEFLPSVVVTDIQNEKFTIKHHPNIIAYSYNTTGFIPQWKMINYEQL